MKTHFKKENYFLHSSIDFFNKSYKFREKFLKKFEFFFEEISYHLNNCINSSEKIIFFCCGNHIISKKIDAKIKYINEIFPKYNLNEIEKLNLKDIDHFVLADIEHQKNLIKNLTYLSENISDDSRLLIVSKSLLWSLIIKGYKFFFKKYAPKKYNFLPYDNLKSYFEACNFEMVRNEKIIACPINIPIIKDIINAVFRLPILNFFCLINITILKKKNIKFKSQNKITYIIPCKNEGGNISIFEKELKKDSDSEFLFCDDKSTDNTKEQIKKLKHKYQNIKYFEGPGICKSENVFKGIEEASEEIIVIYDADHTVKFSDLHIAIKILNTTNADMINCSRMIYPQKNRAMKKLNFLGNIIFAKFFSLIFNKTITDTLCGTKIFYKKDWKKLKRFTSYWGLKDHWGDFDLLLSAYKNNLKLLEVPVHYYEREMGKTKMINLISNTLRMLGLVLNGYYKLKIKKNLKRINF